MNEMNLTEVKRVDEGKVEPGKENAVTTEPTSPYVQGAYRSNFAEEVPITVKCFRANFAIFGMSALLFGICFTACFFKARLGISYPVFVLAAIALIQFVGVNLRNIRENAGGKGSDDKAKGTQESSAASTDRQAADTKKTKEKTEQDRSRIAIPYYIAAMLIAISVVLTADFSMHFFSTVAIVLLLEVAFLELLFSDTENGRNFEERCKELFLLPFTAIANCMTGLIDGFGFLRKMKFFRNEKVRHVLLGVLIAIPLLIVVFALLTSADMIFSSWTETAMDYIFFSSNPYLACLLTVVIYAVAYGIMAAASRMMATKQATGHEQGRRANLQAGVQAAVVQGNEDVLPGKKGSNALTAITVTLLLTLVYLLFCGIQLYFLFGGGNISLPDGFTYAEYARQGFFQLLAVTVLNVIVLMFCRKAAGESSVLRVVLTVFSACTYVMIASAAMRMLLYVDAYSLSFLRIMVLWFLGLNTLLVTGIILAIYRAKFPLFRYFVAVSAVCYIVLAYANVDYIIAAYNTKSREKMEKIDIDYLTTLSSDAAPVLLPALNEIITAEKNSMPGNGAENPIVRAYYELSEDRKLAIKMTCSDYVRNIAENEKTDFRSWNLSRHRAQEMIEEYGFQTEPRARLYFTNYSKNTVFSVGFSSEYSSTGMQNADNTPLGFGERVVIVDDTRTYTTESGTLYLYNKEYGIIDSLLLTDEDLANGTVYVEYHSDPDGKNFFTIGKGELSSAD